jgi:hypothetical protein
MGFMSVPGQMAGERVPIVDGDTIDYDWNGQGGMHDETLARLIGVEPRHPINSRDISQTGIGC